MATTSSRCNRVAAARQLTWLPGANRSAAIARCYELLDGEDWRARWWRELAAPERGYLLRKLDAPLSWTTRPWDQFDAAAQAAIITAAHAAAQLFQCGRRRRGAAP